MDGIRIAEIRERTVPVASPGANAYIDFSHMTASTVAVVSDRKRDGRPVMGFGFNSNGRYAQGGPLRERFIPRLLEAEPSSLLDADGLLDPERCWTVMMANEKPGGHGERSVAVGVLDMALWDLAAKLAELPLAELIAQRYGSGTAEDHVEVYAAGGYYAGGKGIDGLVAEMRGYLDQGYTRVKLKIGGAHLDEDLRRIEAVLDLVGGAGDRVAVDANGRFELQKAIAYAEALGPYGLAWYEEPGDPLDFDLQARLGSHYAPPFATGENLFSHQDVRNLVRYAGLRADRDVLQMDPALSYGLVEFKRMLDVIAEHGWSRRRVIPHGGHQFALSIAAGLGLGGNESYPGVFQPFGGFADASPVEDGAIEVVQAPGVGFEEKAALWELLRELVPDVS